MPGGCRLDALELIPMLLTHNITLFTFDFSGSGMSEGFLDFFFFFFPTHPFMFDTGTGEYISLGHYEQQDVDVVVAYLQVVHVVVETHLLSLSVRLSVCRFSHSIGGHAECIHDWAVGRVDGRSNVADVRCHPYAHPPLRFFILVLHSVAVSRDRLPQVRIVSRASFSTVPLRRSCESLRVRLLYLYP